MNPELSRRLGNITLTDAWNEVPFAERVQIVKSASSAKSIKSLTRRTVAVIEKGEREIRAAKQGRP